MKLILLFFVANVVFEPVYAQEEGKTALSEWRNAHNGGAVVLYCILKAYGRDCDLRDLLQRNQTNALFNSAQGIADGAKARHLPLEIVAMTPPEIKAQRMPIIAHIDGKSPSDGAFLLVARINSNTIYYINGPTGEFRSIETDQFLRMWSGVVIRPKEPPWALWIFYVPTLCIGYLCAAYCHKCVSLKWAGWKVRNKFINGVLGFVVSFGCVPNAEAGESIYALPQSVRSELLEYQRTITHISLEGSFLVLGKPSAESVTMSIAVDGRKIKHLTKTKTVETELFADGETLIQAEKIDGMQGRLAVTRSSYAKVDDPNRRAPVWDSTLFEMIGLFLPNDLSGLAEFTGLEMEVLHLAAISDGTLVTESETGCEIRVEVPDPLLLRVRATNPETYKRQLAATKSETEVAERMAKLQRMQNLPPIRTVILKLARDYRYGVTERLEMSPSGEVMCKKVYKDWRSYGDGKLWFPHTSEITTYGSYHEGRFAGGQVVSVTYSINRLSFERSKASAQITLNPGTRVVDRVARDADARPNAQVVYMVPATEKELLRTLQTIMYQSRRISLSVIVIACVISLLLGEMLFRFTRQIK